MCGLGGGCVWPGPLGRLGVSTHARTLGRAGGSVCLNGAGVGKVRPRLLPPSQALARPRRLAHRVQGLPLTQLPTPQPEPLPPPPAAPDPPRPSPTQAPEAPGDLRVRTQQQRRSCRGGARRALRSRRAEARPSPPAARVVGDAMMLGASYACTAAIGARLPASGSSTHKGAAGARGVQTAEDLQAACCFLGGGGGCLVVLLVVGVDVGAGYWCCALVGECVCVRCQEGAGAGDSGRYRPEEGLLPRQSVWQRARAGTEHRRRGA